jgi:hypothetical protein
MTTVMPPDAPGEAPAEPGREQGRRRTKAHPTPAVKDQSGVPTSLTVKLSAISMESLVRASRLGETNQTDAVNRAVQLYDFVLCALADNRRNALVIVRDGQAERVHLR